jgi:hypothetical protein
MATFMTVVPVLIDLTHRGRTPFSRMLARSMGSIGRC